MRGVVAEKFLLEIADVPCIRGTHRGRYYLVAVADDVCYGINFYRRASKEEIFCDRFIIQRYAPTEDEDPEGLVSNEHTIMPIPCPWQQTEKTA